jgi:hypothetical protein
MEAHPSVAIVTFNCARELIDPDRFADNLVQTVRWQQQPDIVFLALQEVAPIAHSFLGGSFLNPYLAQFGRALRTAVKAWESHHQIVNNGSGGAASAQDASSATHSDDPKDSSYVPIEVRNVGMTACILLVRSEHVQRIRWVETAGTGLGYLDMGNKGCVGVRIGYAVSSKTIVPLTFLAAHLAPGETNRSQRNADWQRIVEDVVFVRRPCAVARQKAPGRENGAGDDQDGETEPLLGNSGGQTSSSGIYGSRSLVFFAGDLNYRTSDLPPTSVDAAAFPQPKSLADFESFKGLFSKDQLTQEHDAHRVLHGFHELPISFPPTYKYARSARVAAAQSGEAVYMESKHSVWAKWRWPSWCDRILTLDEADSAAKKSGIKPEKQEYTSLPMLPSSDHQAVTLYCELDLDAVAAVQETEQAPSVTAPFEIKPDWQSRRAAARRLEVAVGLTAYFGWTWEGNALVMATLIGAWGGWTLIQLILEQS